MSLASCRTCGGEYFWETLLPPGTPPPPETPARQALFVVAHFGLPFVAHVSATLAAGLVCYIAIPLALGMYNHELRYPSDDDEGGTWLTALVVGFSICAVRRSVAKMYRKHTAFFRGEELPKNDKPTIEASGRAFDQLWWWALSARAYVVRAEGVRRFAVELAYDAVWGIAGLWLWHRLDLRCLFAATLLAAIALRFLYPPRRYQNRRQRQAEVIAAKDNVTRFEIHKYFATFCLDCLFFSIVMRIMAGFAFHFATAPFFCTLPETIEWPTPESAFVHWFVGFAVENFMVFVERSLMAPLFALGCDLVILRSVQFDEEHEQYMFVFQQLYEVDPLRAFADAARIYATEMPALILWIHLPLRAAFIAASWLGSAGNWGDILAWLHGAAIGTYEPSADAVSAADIQFPLPLFAFDSVWGKFFELLACLTAFICFLTFPVQRTALRVMLPIAKLVGSVTGLQAYLFDPARRQAVENWLEDDLLADGVEAEAALPPVSTEQKVTRREMWMEDMSVPRFLFVRRVCFAMVFFPLCYCVSVGLFASASAVLGGIRWSATWSVTAPIISIFAVWNLKSAAYASLQSLFVVFCVPFFAAKAALEPFGWNWSSFLADAFASRYKAQQRLATR